MAHNAVPYTTLLQLEVLRPVFTQQATGLQSADIYPTDIWKKCRTINIYFTFGAYPNTTNLDTFVALGRVPYSTELALFWDGGGSSYERNLQKTVGMVYSAARHNGGMISTKKKNCSFYLKLNTGGYLAIFVPFI